MKNIDKILITVENSHCGITATEIYEKLSDQMDKTTVYRNLEKLSREGKINEEFDTKGEKKYSDKDHHHHHFVCNDC
jgi:Fur family ferric uptake transcriptional regulator